MTYAIRRPRRHRIGIAALAFVVVAFLAFSLPPYLTGDPARSRVPATFALHYPLLVTHVMFATVAMVAAVPQLVPWLRRRYPVVHRWTGRVYGMSALPAGVCGLVLGAATPFGPILLASNVIMASLWLWFTINGFLAARQQRFADHRRHMLRSVALTFSIISNRVWTVVLALVLDPLRDSIFHGDETVFLWVLAGATGWLGWTVPLAAVQWWLIRRPVVATSSITRATDTSPV